MKTKRIRDNDVLAIKGACLALDKSTDRRMLKANIQFLIDRYLVYPGNHLPDHLQQM